MRKVRAKTVPKELTKEYRLWGSFWLVNK
jgi:hypothetical protein